MSHGTDVPRRLVILAPNWLGDAVMALPLLADLRRAWPSTQMTVAARPPVAPLYSMLPAIDATLTLGGRGVRQRARDDVTRLAAGAFDAALLLPNSFLAAWLVWRAKIPARWGFARDLRGPLLTRAVPRLRHYGHQAEYYQALGAALGLTAGPAHARIEVSDALRASARTSLQQAGLSTARPFVVFAPGAAYGRAKQWPPRRFAELAQRYRDQDIASVLVGAAADVATCRDVATLADAIDLSGRTDLPTLAGVLAAATAVVSNDSGAMHLAAAVGTRVIAIFGPTNEHRTAPLRAGDHAPAPEIVTAEAWCRPCMLRECPIDHRCMTRVTGARVFQIAMHQPPGTSGAAT